MEIKQAQETLHLLGVPRLVVPEEMPYSLEQVQMCKVITQEGVLKDYLNLKAFHADTNPKKFCGNPIIYQYQFNELLKCRRDTKNYKTIEKWFADPELKEKLWKDTVKRGTGGTRSLTHLLQMYMNVIVSITGQSFHSKHPRRNTFTRSLKQSLF